ncbi:unnamed protein product, partial [Rotaria sp. Silwood1]
MKKQNRKPTKAVSIRSLFRYATFADLLYMLLAIITSAAFGATNPLFFVVFVIGCVIIICGYIRVTAFNITAERQTRTIRQTLFQSILKKDIVYFDTHKTGELSTLISDDINKIRDGIGDKLGALIDTISIFICCIIIGFVKGWKLALVIFSTLPVIVTTFIITSKLITSLTTIELNAYRKAGAVAEEVITSIRTVLSYNGQEKEIQRSVYSLEHISPQFQALIQAQVAAYTVQEVIDEPSTINSDSETGLKKDDLIGDIRFSNVHFSYPSRRDVKVLTNLSFDVKRGQTVALIGSSGSGKSTCIQLLQRFYDQDSGSIFIDEKQINEYNLKWLRQHIGVVSQEPILFHATIRENILFGRDSATDEEIHEAAKMANAHDFIMTLPDKYETQVGERGAALSGGQKQRIAIARALIRNPKILLLDEATSALDNESEKIVQDALYRTAKGRTTLVIAHRLSTIRNADKIIVMQKGEIVEEGDHDSLMSIRGTYFTLIEQQSLHQAEEEEELEFEQQQAAKILLSDQLCLDNSNIKRNCSSTLVSITPSTLDVFLEHISPQFQALIQARVAAYTVQIVIDEPSTINSNSETGLKKDDFIGDIRFSNVHFSYPLRQNVTVLTNLSFNIKHGQTVALVGLSGSGKSTCIQLLQRFYDPDSGSIFIDEKKINEYNLKWLRQHIGVVSQEPILFHATIRENILFGRDSATDEEIHQAAKMANAHDFIMTLPDKYETQVGERGATLSGGQKQRIAIARALIRNPKILLLDEATSALDNESEKIVQDALDRATEGRTTLVIAHRLSTIRNADKIIVMQKGQVVEEGDHDSLMSIRGIYFTLIQQQSLRQAEEEEELEFEQQQTAKILLSDQLDLDNSNIKKDRRSTLDSITPSVLAVLYGKKNLEIDEDLEENDDEKIKMKKKRVENITLAILRINTPEWILIVIGCIAALFTGALAPSFSIIRTKITVVFQGCDKDARNQKIILYALLHVGLGISGLISQTIQ